MIRNIFSGVAGYGIWTAIFLGGAAVLRTLNSGMYDADGIPAGDLLLVLHLVISVVASVAAGWSAAWLAGPGGLRVAVVLAGCLLATGIAVQASNWNVLPVWYHLIFLVLLVPVTLLGAGLAKRPRVQTAIG